MATNRYSDNRTNSTRSSSGRSTYRSYGYTEEEYSEPRRTRSTDARASRVTRSDAAARRTSSSARPLSSRSTSARPPRDGERRSLRESSDERRVRRPSGERVSQSAHRTGARRPEGARRRPADSRRISKQEWMAKRKKQNKIKQYVIYGGVALIAILVLVLVAKLLSGGVNKSSGVIKNAGNTSITQKLLTKSPNTRSGQALTKVTGIIIHNTGTAEKTADQMYEYYEDLAKSGSTTESMHFIVGLDGKVIQTIPCDEIAFHVMSKNDGCIGIQYCQSGADGELTSETRAALVELVAKLCKDYDLTSANVERHYDITGRLCPQYFVDNEELWSQFKNDVDAAIK